MSENQIRLSDFRGTDDAASFALAMNYLREHPGTTLSVEPGTHTIPSELARNRINPVGIQDCVNVKTEQDDG